MLAYRSLSKRQLLNVTVLGLGAFLFTACDESELTLPTADEVEGHYSFSSDFSARMNGNVAELIVVQGADQLRRGGSLWAKVGPYIFLFNSETQSLFEAYSGLAGVRVITRDSAGREVARALLQRSALNAITWSRALRVSGVARRDGTRRPSTLSDLVRFGEQYTQFEYSSRYVTGD